MSVRAVVLSAAKDLIAGRKRLEILRCAQDDMMFEYGKVQ
jgi:hypothetical protein